MPCLVVPAMAGGGAFIVLACTNVVRNQCFVSLNMVRNVVNVRHATKYVRGASICSQLMLRLLLFVCGFVSAWRVWKRGDDVLKALQAGHQVPFHPIFRRRPA
ncbi:hypothetical protein RAS12_11470 [Achromobacter seleniivolatilans]|uniref:Uncharacterized protein n=1 Tax=Achromobacter seleniivolatilans TaxID=3047478 RepID=A0ABY9M7K0_9BURK|nr:hypothetical protein [Achromobacter sp. R39]WMD22961.1 hypothetical protein RAS12_11470 [Achromobacter sp. R39]